MPRHAPTAAKRRRPCVTTVLALLCAGAAVAPARADDGGPSDGAVAMTAANVTEAASPIVWGG
jgi:hypothetical protein